VLILAVVLTLCLSRFSLENAVLAITSGAIAKLQNDKKLTDVQFPEMCTTCELPPPSPPPSPPPFISRLSAKFSPHPFPASLDFPSFLPSIRAGIWLLPGCELEQLLSQKCTPLHSLHTSEKLDVVVSSTESMELTARNLQRVGDLQQYINTPYLQGVNNPVRVLP
jgi:hypothetical protein